MNKAVAFAIDKLISLRIPKLNKDTLRVIGFADSSFGNNADLSTQLGYVYILGDETESVMPVSLKSYKSRSVTRSAIEGELIALSDVFDVVAVLAAELEAMLK